MTVAEKAVVIDSESLRMPVPPSTAIFAGVLKRLRLESGLTPKELARKAKCNRTHISRLENKRRGPSLEMVLRLSRVLNHSAADLVDEIEQKLEQLDDG